MNRPAARIAAERLATQCRPLVADLFQGRPIWMWTDFAVTLVVAYTAASSYLMSPLFSWRALLLYPVAICGLYRLSMFIHEIVHFRQGQMPGFSTTWNFLAGVPLLMPSFLYASHLAHHSSQHYGTDEDGEYLPLALGTWGGLMLFLGQILIQPLYVFTRFFLGTPLSLLHPRIRRWVLERASSLVINFSYRREVPPEGFGRLNFWIEMACMLRAWALVLSVTLGYATWSRFPMIYLLACGALGLNHLRTMAAHRYRSPGDPMSHDDQFLDSTNITGNIATELLCPLGLRYHALHHLLPGIPYYHLGLAHRRLASELPASSPYHAATYASITDVMRELTRSVRSAATNRSVGPHTA